MSTVMMLLFWNPRIRMGQRMVDLDIAVPVGYQSWRGAGDEAPHATAMIARKETKRPRRSLPRGPLVSSHRDSRTQSSVQVMRAIEASADTGERVARHRAEDQRGDVSGPLPAFAVGRVLVGPVGLGELGEESREETELRT